MPTEEYKKRKRAYVGEYNKRNYRTINVFFRLDDDEQIAVWDWLHTKYSTAGYIRDLIVKAYNESKEKGE